RLLQHLRQGLESIAYNPFETTQLFKELERLHLARLRAAAVTEPAAATKPLAEAASPDEVSPEPVVAEKEASPQPVAEVNQTTAADLPAEQVQVQVKTVEVQVKSGEQTDVQAERFVVLSAPESTLAEDDQHLSLVNNITQGSWFEMTDAGGQKYRCRLAAIIKATGKYVLVSRSGMKVAEETRQTLASALRSGKLRVLDDGMLFDRALEAVIGSLREQRTTSN